MTERSFAVHQKEERIKSPKTGNEIKVNTEIVKQMTERSFAA